MVDELVISYVPEYYDQDAKSIQQG